MTKKRYEVWVKGPFDRDWVKVATYRSRIQAIEHAEFWHRVEGLQAFVDSAFYTAGKVPYFEAI